MHNGASLANRLRARVSERIAVFYGATLDNRSAEALAHRRPAVLALLDAMVDPVANAGVADTLEARLADARKRHEDGEYGSIPWAIAELGIRAQWATEHPFRPVSTQPVRNESGVDDEVDGCARVSSNNGTKQIVVIKVDGGVDWSQARVQRSTATASSSRADVNGRRRSPLRSGGGLSATTHVMADRIAPAYGYLKFSLDWITVVPLQGRRDLITWRESIEPQMEVAGLKGFADGTVPTPLVVDVELRGEFRAAHLLTFMANLLSAGQLKESEVQLQGDGDEMLLVAATGEVLDRARYNGRVLCTDLCPCSTRSLSTEVVALRTIVSATKSTPDRFHVRLVHIGVDTIKSLAKHEVATGLNIKSSTRADPPCVSCVGGKLARQTFSDKGSDDSVPAADREEAQPHTGMGVGLHGDDMGAAGRGASRIGGNTKGAVDRGAVDGAVDKGAIEVSTR
ncbi:unnamed protein product [Closterium sp. NIES-54]